MTGRGPLPGGLLVITRLINSYLGTGAMWFVPQGLVLLAVAELFVPVLHDVFCSGRQSKTNPLVIHRCPLAATPYRENQVLFDSFR